MPHAPSRLRRAAATPASASAHDVEPDPLRERSSISRATTQHAVHTMPNDMLLPNVAASAQQAYMRWCCCHPTGAAFRRTARARATRGTMSAKNMPDTFNHRRERRFAVVDAQPDTCVHARSPIHARTGCAAVPRSPRCSKCAVRQSSNDALFTCRTQSEVQSHQHRAATVQPRNALFTQKAGSKEWRLRANSRGAGYGKKRTAGSAQACVNPPWQQEVLHTCRSERRWRQAPRISAAAEIRAYRTTDVL